MLQRLSNETENESQTYSQYALVFNKLSRLALLFDFI